MLMAQHVRGVKARNEGNRDPPMPLGVDFVRMPVVEFVFCCASETPVRLRIVIGISSVKCFLHPCRQDTCNNMVAEDHRCDQ